MRRIGTITPAAYAFRLAWRATASRAALLSGRKPLKAKIRAAYAQSAAAAEARIFWKLVRTTRTGERIRRFARAYHNECPVAASAAELYAFSEPRITVRTRDNAGHQRRMNSAATASLRRRRLAPRVSDRPKLGLYNLFVFAFSYLNNAFVVFSARL